MIICYCEDCVHNEGRQCQRQFIEIDYENKDSLKRNDKVCAACNRYEKKEDEE